MGDRERNLKEFKKRVKELLPNIQNADDGRFVELVSTDLPLSSRQMLYELYKEIIQLENNIKIERKESIEKWTNLELALFEKNRKVIELENKQLSHNLSTPSTRPPIQSQPPPPQPPIQAQPPPPPQLPIQIQPPLQPIIDTTSFWVKSILVFLLAVALSAFFNYLLTPSKIVETMVPNLLSSDHYCNFQSINTKYYLRTDGNIVNSIEWAKEWERYIVKKNSNGFTIQSANKDFNDGYIEYKPDQNIFKLVSPSQSLNSKCSIFKFNPIHHPSINNVFEIETCNGKILNFNKDSSGSISTYIKGSEKSGTQVLITCHKK